jgi:hypothetical protein
MLKSTEAKTSAKANGSLTVLFALNVLEIVSSSNSWTMCFGGADGDRVAAQKYYNIVWKESL